MIFFEYLELMMQYGFITLFAAGFPLAPLFAFLINLVEMYVDRFKLLYLIKRPFPHASHGIGRWLWVLRTISKTAIITNAAILCFTMKVFDNWEFFEGSRLAPFIGIVILASLVRK